jgi:hypothetical protein
MARSSFYYHQNKELTDKYKEIKELIKAIYQDIKDAMGYKDNR